MRPRTSGSDPRAALFAAEANDGIMAEAIRLAQGVHVDDATLAKLWKSAREDPRQLARLVVAEAWRARAADAAPADARSLACRLAVLLVDAKPSENDIKFWRAELARDARALDKAARGGLVATDAELAAARKKLLAAGVDAAPRARPIATPDALLRMARERVLAAGVPERAVAKLDKLIQGKPVDAQLAAYVELEMRALGFDTTLMRTDEGRAEAKRVAEAIRRARAGKLTKEDKRAFADPAVRRALMTRGALHRGRWYPLATADDVRALEEALR